MFNHQIKLIKYKTFSYEKYGFLLLILVSRKMEIPVNNFDTPTMLKNNIIAKLNTWCKTYPTRNELKRDSKLLRRKIGNNPPPLPSIPSFDY